MNYNSGNLAFKDNYYKKDIAYSNKDTNTVSLSNGEKIVYLVSILVLMLLSICVLFGFSKLSVTNSNISEFERKINYLKQQNMQLGLNINLVNSEESIQKFIQDKKLEKVSVQNLSQ